MIEVTAHDPQATIFRAYVETVSDMQRLSDALQIAVDTTDSKLPAKVLWFSLIASKVGKNQYIMKMPHLTKTMMSHCKNRPSSTVLQVTSGAADKYGVPESLQTENTAFWTASNIVLQIRGQDTWQPPQDLDVLRTTKPPARLFVELFLDQVQYVCVYTPPLPEPEPRPLAPRRPPQSVTVGRRVPRHTRHAAVAK